MNSKLKELLSKENMDKAMDSFVEKLKREGKESIEYKESGSFDEDVKKLKSYLENNEFFNFEDNSYSREITFISEKYLLKEIYHINAELLNSEKLDEQEYELFFDDLIFHYLHGLGTIITVYLKK